MDWMSWSELELPDGFRVEVPLQMMEWVENVADVLARGLLVTVDYGYRNEELLDPALRQGTLRGYYQHQLIEDPLLHPGEMDLTAHIHLDALIKKGEEEGFKEKYLGKQRTFLLEHGLFDHLVEHEGRDPFSAESKLNRAIRSFAMPGGMSEAYHVLIQEKS